MTEQAHVMPIHDIVEHQADGLCPCGPTIEHVKHEDGHVVVVVTHRSLAGTDLT